MQTLTGRVIVDKKLKRGSKPSLSGRLQMQMARVWKNITVELKIAETAQAIAIAKTDENGTFIFPMSEVKSIIFTLKDSWCPVCK